MREAAALILILVATRGVQAAPAPPGGGTLPRSTAPAPQASPAPAVNQDDADFSRAAELRIGKQYDAALAVLLLIEERAATQELRGEALYQEGLILEESNRLPEALAAYASVIKDNASAPAAPHAQLNWAHLMRKQGKLDEASEGYRVLALGHPRFAGAALVAQAGIEDSRGRKLDAMLAYRNVLRNFPQAPEAREARAGLDALCTLALAKSASTSWEEALMRGDCLMDRDKLADAQRVYESALKRRLPVEAKVELLMALGTSLDAQDRPGAAARTYRQVVRAAPRTVQAAAAQMLIVQGALDRGRYAEAVKELESIVKHYPGTGQMAQALFMIGSCQEALHNRKKAEDAWRRVLDLAPNTPWAAEAQQNLVRLLEQAP